MHALMERLFVVRRSPMVPMVYYRWCWLCSVLCGLGFFGDWLLERVFVSRVDLLAAGVTWRLLRRGNVEIFCFGCSVCCCFTDSTVIPPRRLPVVRHPGL